MGAIFLFLLGAILFIVVTFFIVKIAVREAILEAARMTSVHDDVYQRKKIKQAIIEALDEHEKNKISQRGAE